MKKGVIAAIIVILCLCTGGATAFLTVSALGTGAKIDRVAASLAEAEARRDSLKEEFEAKQGEVNALNAAIQNMENGTTQENSGVEGAETQGEDTAQPEDGSQAPDSQSPEGEDQEDEPDFQE